jgi:hypothetical protein
MVCFFGRTPALREGLEHGRMVSSVLDYVVLAAVAIFHDGIDRLRAGTDPRRYPASSCRGQRSPDLVLRDVHDHSAGLAAAVFVVLASRRPA